MKHKYYDVIVAIAEGKPVERKAPGAAWIQYNQSIHMSPLDSDIGVEWRIKHVPVIKVEYYVHFVDINEHGFEVRSGYEEIKPNLERWDLKITYMDDVIMQMECPK